MTKRAARSAVFLFVIGCFGISLLGTQQATAAGDITFSWADSVTLSYSGSGVTSSGLVKFSSTDQKTPSSGVAGARLAVHISYSGNYGGESYSGKELDCFIPVAITLKNNTLGRDLSVAANDNPPDSIGAPGSPSNCPTNYSGYHSFDGSYQTSNDYPAAGGGSQQETPAQQIVSVKVSYYPKNPPANIPIKLTIGSKTLTAIAAKTTKDGDGVTSTDYAGNVASVPAGDYKICATAGGKDYCQNGVKGSFNAGVEFFTIGDPNETNATKHVNVGMRINPRVDDPTKTQSFGPYPIQLQKKDGTVIGDSKITIEYDQTMVDACVKDGWCGGVIWIGGGTTFSKIDPGDYKVCITGTTICKSFTKVKHLDADVELGKLSSSDLDAADAAAATASDASKPDDCPITETSKLKWIICPLVTIGDNTIGAMEKIIKQFLYTPIDQITQGIEGSAKNFRNIGLSLLVIAALIMIASQAFGLELFDAYTIKKIMPRLLIAAIGIALATPILIFVIDFFNDIGLLIDKIIQSSVVTSGSGAGTGTHVAAFGIGATGAIAVGVALGGLGLLSLMGTVILSLLVGLLVLAVRQMVIMVCVLMAPIAIAAYILPGTQKIWEFWKNAFITSLVMFPIIMAFIASGTALSNLLGQGGTEMQFLALIVRYAPYFLLPFAFKLAGGLMSTVFSLANDRSRGGFDRLKNIRGAQMAKNSAALKNGDRFNNARLNALSSRATTSRLGFGARGREAYQQKINNAGAEFSKSAAGQALQHNDGALRALTYASESQARANMAKDFGMDEGSINTAVAAAKAGGGFGRQRQTWAANQLAATGTGYDNLEQVGKTIARASNGNQSQVAALAGNINSVTKGTGRFDLAPGFGRLNGLAQAEMAGDSAGTSAAAYHGATVAASRGADPVTLLRGKPAQVKNLTSALESHLETNLAILNDNQSSAQQKTEASMEVKQTIGQINQLDQSKSFASQENQMVVNELVVGSQPTLQAAINRLRSDTNGEGHMEDIKRFSAPPQNANNPDYQPPTQ